MNIIERPLPNGSKHNNPKRIVVHAMGEYIKDPNPILAVDFLHKLGYSAHALVLPNCDVMICRNTDQGAYHARGFNKDSLGIEFLVEGEHDYSSFIQTIKTDWLAPGQFEAGIELIQHWQSLFGIGVNYVDRHSDLSPGRKVDPGDGFPWKKFKQHIGDV